MTLVCHISRTKMVDGSSGAQLEISEASLTDIHKEALRFNLATLDMFSQ